LTWTNFWKDFPYPLEKNRRQKIRTRTEHPNCPFSTVVFQFEFKNKGIKTLVTTLSHYADITELEQQIDALVADLYGVQAAISPSPKRKSPPKDLKEYLRDVCLPELRRNFSYIDTKTLHAAIKTAKLTCSAGTLNNYMKEMETGGFVFNAGKGWYSFVKTPYRIDRTPLETLISQMKEKFPFLDFACFSTLQVNRYMHHLLGKSVTFLQADRDTLSAIFAYLEDLHYNAYLNPTKLEIEKTFNVSSDENTIIIRPLPTRSPVDNHAAEIEKLLVDLRMELKNLPLMTVDEFKAMARNTITSERVNMAEMLSYAKRRQLPLSELVDDPECIISNFTHGWR